MFVDKESQYSQIEILKEDDNDAEVFFFLIFVFQIQMCHIFWRKTDWSISEKYTDATA